MANDDRSHKRKREADDADEEDDERVTYSALGLHPFIGRFMAHIAGRNVPDVMSLARMEGNYLQRHAGEETMNQLYAGDVSRTVAVSASSSAAAASANPPPPLAAAAPSSVVSAPSSSASLARVQRVGHEELKFLRRLGSGGFGGQTIQRVRDTTEREASDDNEKEKEK